jgi:hypothetical protein
MTAVEALTLARAEGVAVSLPDGAQILYRSRGKAPSHLLEALRACALGLPASMPQTASAIRCTGPYVWPRWRAASRRGRDFTPTWRS